MVHLGIANFTNSPEMIIDKDEGNLLANATVNVLDQFDIHPDPKMQAIFGLIIASGSVYGPRIFLINKRRAAEREKPPVDLSAQVIEFPTPVEVN